MTDDAPPSDAREICWVAIFGANMIPPLALVWPRTDRGGQEGLLIGLAVLFALWQFAVPRVEPLRALLVPGGIAVAAAQVFPAGHAAAAAVACTLVEPETFSRPARLDQESGFFVAVAYAVLLTLAAAVAGLVLRAVGRRFRRDPAPPQCRRGRTILTPMQTRMAAALHRLTDLPLKDCQAFLAEDEWDMRRAVARMHAYRWLSGLMPSAWERFRQDLRDCGITDVALPG